MTEHWQPGDVVLDAQGDLWTRSAQHDVDQGWPWAYTYGSGRSVPEGSVSESCPARPLTLLIRGGKPCAITVPGGCCVGERWGPAASEGDGVGELLLGHISSCPVNPGGVEEIEIPRKAN
jgi:hypothetical protein